MLTSWQGQRDLVHATVACPAARSLAQKKLSVSDSGLSIRPRFVALLPPWRFGVSWARRASNVGILNPQSTTQLDATITQNRPDGLTKHQGGYPTCAGLR